MVRNCLLVGQLGIDPTELFEPILLCNLAIRRTGLNLAPQGLGGERGLHVRPQQQIKAVAGPRNQRSLQPVTSSVTGFLLSAFNARRSPHRTPTSPPGSTRSNAGCPSAAPAIMPREGGSVWTALGSTSSSIPPPANSTAASSASRRSMTPRSRRSLAAPG